MNNLTGVDDPYEPPTAPELVLPTERLSPDGCADRVLAVLGQRGYLGGRWRERRG